MRLIPCGETANCLISSFRASSREKIACVTGV